MSECLEDTFLRSPRNTQTAMIPSKSSIPKKEKITQKVSSNAAGEEICIVEVHQIINSEKFGEFINFLNRETA